MSPTPRASRARKAFVHVVKANPDARSVGDDSSTRLLTPFLRGTTPPNHQPCQSTRSRWSTSTAANKLRPIGNSECSGKIAVVACLCNPSAVARPASPAPAMTMSSTAAIGCSCACRPAVGACCLGVETKRQQTGGTKNSSEDSQDSYVLMGQELL